MSAATVNSKNCDVSPIVPEEATDPKPSSSTIINSQRQCQECLQQAFRYVCPCCSLRTCSLRCCVAHKKRTGCNGKRDRTQFLRVAHMTDATLVSDYHFLEDVLGTIERAKRTVGNTTGTINNNNNSNNKRPRHGHQPQHNNNNTGVETMDAKPQHSMLQQIKHIEETLHDEKIVSTENASAGQAAHDDDNNNNMNEVDASSKQQKNSIHSPPHTNNSHHPFASSAQQHQQHFQLGPKWRHFWQQAKIRGIHLMLMPKGMQRRKDNSSYINKKDNVLHWKIDVRMHPSIASSTDTETTITATSSMECTIHSLKLPEHAILWEELQQRRDHFLGIKSPNHDNGNSDSNNYKQETIHWLMRKLPSPSNRPCFIEISSPSDDHKDRDANEEDPQSNTTRNGGGVQGSLQAILQGMTIIEYPTIEGVPESRLHEFPRAIQEL